MLKLVIQLFTKLIDKHLKYISKRLCDNFVIYIRIFAEYNNNFKKLLVFINFYFIKFILILKKRNRKQNIF